MQSLNKDARAMLDAAMDGTDVHHRSKEDILDTIKKQTKKIDDLQAAKVRLAEELEWARDELCKALNYVHANRRRQYEKHLRSGFQKEFDEAVRPILDEMEHNRVFEAGDIVERMGFVYRANRKLCNAHWNDVESWTPLYNVVHDFGRSAYWYDRIKQFLDSWDIDIRHGIGHEPGGSYESTISIEMNPSDSVPREG